MTRVLRDQKNERASDAFSIVAPPTSTNAASRPRPIEPAAMTIPEFGSLSNVSRSQIYREIGSGALPAIKVGRRTLINIEAAKAWLAAQLPDLG